MDQAEELMRDLGKGRKRQLAEENPKLIPIPIEDPMLVDVSLVWKKDHYISSGMRRFVEYVKTQNPFVTE